MPRDLARVIPKFGKLGAPHATTAAGTTYANLSELDAWHMVGGVKTYCCDPAGYPLGTHRDPEAAWRGFWNLFDAWLGDHDRDGVLWRDYPEMQSGRIDEGGRVRGGAKPSNGPFFYVVHARVAWEPAQ